MSNRAHEHANQYIAAYHERSLEGICRNMTGSSALFLAGGMFVFSDLSAWRAHHENEWNAFPDARFDVTSMWVGAETCTVEGMWHGTMENEFKSQEMSPFSPTGRRTSLPCAIVFESDERGIRRLAGYWNSLIAMSELGLRSQA